MVINSELERLWQNLVRSAESADARTLSDILKQATAGSHYPYMHLLYSEIRQFSAERLCFESRVPFADAGNLWDEIQHLTLRRETDPQQRVWFIAEGTAPWSSADTVPFCLVLDADGRWLPRQPGDADIREPVALCHLTSAGDFYRNRQGGWSGCLPVRFAGGGNEPVYIDIAPGCDSAVLPQIDAAIAALLNKPQTEYHAEITASLYKHLFTSAAGLFGPCDERYGLLRDLRQTQNPAPLISSPLAILADNTAQGISLQVWCDSAIDPENSVKLCYDAAGCFTGIAGTE